MTKAELDALKARFAASQQPPWYAYMGGNPAADVGLLLAEVERLRAELADVLEIAIARGDSLGYESMDYCERLERLRPDSEILTD